MRYVSSGTLLLSAVAMAACQGELPDRGVQGLEAFEPIAAFDHECVLRVPGGGGVLFTSLRDDPAKRAFVEFGGERMMLFQDGDPVLPTGGEVVERLYAIENYPEYEGRLELRRAGDGVAGEIFAGVVEMRAIRGGVSEVIEARDVSGSCEG